MPYSDYIAECCLSLANHPEAPTDKYLYHIVQLQHIMESTDFLSAQQQQPVVADDPTTQAAVHAVRTELSAFRANLPFELSESRKFRPHPWPLVKVEYAKKHLPSLFTFLPRSAVGDHWLIWCFLGAA